MRDSQVQKRGRQQRSEQGKQAEVTEVASERDRQMSGQWAGGAEGQEFSEFTGLSAHCRDMAGYLFLEFLPCHS